MSTAARSQEKRSLQAWGLEGKEQNCQFYVAARETYKAEGENLTAEILKGLKREAVSEVSIGKATEAFVGKSGVHRQQGGVLT